MRCKGISYEGACYKSCYRDAAEGSELCKYHQAGRKRSEQATALKQDEFRKKVKRLENKENPS